MKTKKYLLEINVLDTIEVSATITASEYKKKLASLKRQVAETQANSYSVAIEREKVVDFDTYTRKTYKVTLGTTDIELIEIICKPGYSLS